jgi:2-succinyl-5-enolpyruvyl-6-hydroxy-3-cyclohexene-1-carboxylate synthase
MKNTNKLSARLLSTTAARHGVRYVVVSPGSRNAPLVIAFNRNPNLQVQLAVDERSAGFIALGIWQATRTPVILCCTSGTALLNYAPAIAEAHYQDAALMVVSADRPPHKIDIGEGQTIRQPGVYDNYIRHTCALPLLDSKEADLREVQSQMDEAFQKCMYPVPGPVHINIPFEEPLYELSEEDLPQIETDPKNEFRITESDLPTAAAFHKFSKPMLLVGQVQLSLGAIQRITQMSDGGKWVVLSETTSNLWSKNIIANIDKTLATGCTDSEISHPDLLITIGGNIISKRVKEFLRSVPNLVHWHIDAALRKIDTYGALKKVLPIDADTFVQQYLPEIPKTDCAFTHLWSGAKERAERAHSTYFQNLSNSDIKVFKHLSDQVSRAYHIQSGNSSVVRYFQLFDRGWAAFFANRGTSGIEGSLSTAVGYARSVSAPVLCVLGDLSFQYDLHGLWQSELPENLRILVINNGGGGIFRYISNTELPEFEPFFEAHHTLIAQAAAQHFNVPYECAENETRFLEALPSFLENAGRCRILEVFTPRLQNAEMLKDYFQHIRRFH